MSFDNVLPFSNANQSFKSFNYLLTYSISNNDSPIIYQYANPEIKARLIKRSFSHSRISPY